eukprot:gnl/TRDRNA2_/TRDRNA2_140337_c0_seq2.p1 gnl/TRDRNA2_/TRDRNA2_140337_c0~~gnl/TRDRNA2_/TRDRNA2_140337_c0_seq2.p1  ORF type:complete len:184 (+),score=4.72 gnl/TRDRNA2_/TRDRNA2_140337_c0_seq2:80-631(+)
MPGRKKVAKKKSKPPRPPGAPAGPEEEEIVEEYVEEPEPPVASAGPGAPMTIPAPRPLYSPPVVNRQLSWTPAPTQHSYTQMPRVLSSSQSVPNATPRYTPMARAVQHQFPSLPYRTFSHDQLGQYPSRTSTAITPSYAAPHLSSSSIVPYTSQQAPTYAAPYASFTAISPCTSQPALAPWTL